MTQPTTEKGLEHHAMQYELQQGYWRLFVQALIRGDAPGCEQIDDSAADGASFELFFCGRRYEVSFRYEHSPSPMGVIAYYRVDSARRAEPRFSFLGEAEVDGHGRFSDSRTVQRADDCREFHTQTLATDFESALG